MQFQPAFEQMRAIVEADDCLLRGYKQDFYQFDLLHLTKLGRSAVDTFGSSARTAHTWLHSACIPSSLSLWNARST